MQNPKDFKHPVDRGWAWMICFSTFMANFFVTGGIRIVGLLFIELIEYFETDNAIAAMVVALLSAGFAICSCIGNILGVRFGMRPVALTGAVIAFLGKALTVVAPDIKVVLITLGLMSGIGYGFMFGPSMVMIGQYFKKRTSLAGGLSVAGGSIGQLVLPHFFNFMSARYAFRGAMLMYSALALHAVPAMMLLRPPSFYESRLTPDGSGVEAEKERRRSSVKISDGRSLDGRANGNDVHRNGGHRANGLVAGQRLPKKTRYWLADGSIVEKRASLFLLEGEAASLFATSVQDIVKEIEQLPAIEEAEQEQEEADRKSKSTPRSPLGVFCRKCCDNALLSNPVFALFALGLSFGHGGFVATCLYSPPFGYELWGNKTLVAVIISVIGISDFVGRIGGGIVAGLNVVRKPYLVGGSFLISGVCSLLMPFATVMPVFFLFTVALGLLGGTYMAQLVVLIVELFGHAHLASGMGLSMMFMGLFVIPIPPMLGAAQKTAGSYSISLRLSGMLLIFGGLAFCAIPLLEWYKRRKNCKRETTAENERKEEEEEKEEDEEEEKRNYEVETFAKPSSDPNLSFVNAKPTIISNLMSSKNSDWIRFLDLEESVI